MLRLFPFLLIFLLASPVVADSVYRDGSATGALVGAFSPDLDGHFVDVDASSDGAIIATATHAVELDIALGDAVIDGPLVDFGNLQVHDNVYGWIHFQGDARMRAAIVEEIPRGLRVDGLYLAALDLAWAHDGAWLTINASDVLISSDGAFQNLGPEPSAWGLLQGGPDGEVMDWFTFGGAPFSTLSTDDEVALNLVGTIGDDAPDILIRLEEDSFFEPRHDRFTFRFNSLAAGTATEQGMLAERGGFTFHSRDVGHSIVDLRLPTGMSGQVRWQQDLIAPVLDDVRITNITPYAPLAKAPELVAGWDEAVWGELHVGGQQKVATHAAPEVRFRLTGLQPNTHYTYTLTARDLAGNTMVHEGAFSTGSSDGVQAAINVTEIVPTRAGHEVHFNAILGNGDPAPMGMVHAFIDKTAADDRLRTHLGGYVIEVPAGARELRIEVQSAGGRISEVVAFPAAQGAPAGLLLAPLALLLARRR